MVAAVLLTLDRLPELSELLPRAVAATFPSGERGLGQELPIVILSTSSSVGGNPSNGITEKLYAYNPEVWGRISG